MSLAIRSAGEDDAALVFHFVRQLAAYEKLLHEVVADEHLIREAIGGANPKTFCDLAFWDGKPAGFALWFYNFSTFHGRPGIYLEDLYVEPEFRGKGIGLALIRRLARRCVDEGLTRLQWSVLNWNEPSINFYKALGALPVDEWTVFRVSGDRLRELAK